MSQPARSLQGLVRPASVLSWDHPKWWPARCPVCGWEGMSNETAGGNQIADTGDYNDCVCPVCIAPGGDGEKGRWVVVEEIPQPNANLSDAPKNGEPNRPDEGRGGA